VGARCCSTGRNRPRPTEKTALMTIRSRSALRIGGVAASIHLIVLLLACIISFSSDDGFMGGHSYYFFQGLWIGDLPLSIFFDMLIFVGHPVAGLTVWAVLGTAWWFGLGAAGCYFWGEVIEILRIRLRKDIERMKVDGLR
jgi:hypothetical protein